MRYFGCLVILKNHRRKEGHELWRAECNSESLLSGASSIISDIFDSSAYNNTCFYHDVVYIMDKELIYAKKYLTKI